jgi:hypothetical protein
MIWLPARACPARCDRQRGYGPPEATAPQRLRPPRGYGPPEAAAPQRLRPPRGYGGATAPQRLRPPVPQSYGRLWRPRGADRGAACGRGRWGTGGSACIDTRLYTCIGVYRHLPHACGTSPLYAAPPPCMQHLPRIHGHMRRRRLIWSRRSRARAHACCAA